MWIGHVVLIILFTVLFILGTRFIVRVFSGIRFRNDLDVVIGFLAFGFAGLASIYYISKNMGNISAINMWLKDSIFIGLFILHMALLSVSTLWIAVIIAMVILIKYIIYEFKTIWIIRASKNIYYEIIKLKGIVRIYNFIKFYIYPFTGVKVSLNAIIKMSLFVAYLGTGIFLVTVVYNQTVLRGVFEENMLEVVKRDFEVYKEIFIISLIPYGISFVNTKKESL